MAASLETGVPWVMCQQDDAPYPIVSQYNHWNSPYLDHDAEIVREDDILKLEVAGLKSMLSPKKETFPSQTGKGVRCPGLARPPLAGPGVFDRWERRIGPAAVENKRTYLQQLISRSCAISQIARDAVADIQEDSEAVPENEEALNLHDQGAEADVQETADEDLEDDADENDFMDDEGEEDVNEGQDAVETQESLNLHLTSPHLRWFLRSLVHEWRGSQKNLQRPPTFPQ
ncbi:Beta-galactosidase 2 [Platanthera guangdongensis]|uniref:Beta-galactosidase 2 n=1 Tax=Platanthera guangdongensis TaxID=2320717 RepID=A0ABR2LPF4_9ASPA